MTHTTDPDFLKLIIFFFFTKFCIFLLQKIRTAQSNTPPKKWNVMGLLSILCSPSRLVDCLDYFQDPIKHSLAVKFLSMNSCRILGSLFQLHLRAC